MDKKLIEEYSSKYKKASKKMIIITSIFLIVLGISVVALGIFMCLPDQNNNKNNYIIGIILIVAGFFNLFLGVRYIFFGYRNLKAMKDIDAAKRYIKIHGIENKENIEQ